MVAQVTGEVLQFCGLGAPAMKMGGRQDGDDSAVHLLFTVDIPVAKHSGQNVEVR